MINQIQMKEIITKTCTEDDFFFYSRQIAGQLATDICQIKTIYMKQ